jgi:hypothetical protein
MQFLLGKSRLRQKLHELMHQPNIFCMHFLYPSLEIKTSDLKGLVKVANMDDLLFSKLLSGSLMCILTDLAGHNSVYKGYQVNRHFIWIVR